MWLDVCFENFKTLYTVEGMYLHYVSWAIFHVLAFMVCYDLPSCLPHDNRGIRFCEPVTMDDYGFVFKLFTKLELLNNCGCQLHNLPAMISNGFHVFGGLVIVGTKLSEWWNVLKGTLVQTYCWPGLLYRQKLCVATLPPMMCLWTVAVPFWLMWSSHFYSTFRAFNCTS